ncbi:Endo-1,3(4)-beta-glucanase 1 [Smittium culicis]|uniref:glucan endo-1,3-beta-D-glucosidase n=1 Tax=Smittium culicis TaxID=133412 RepID=A0A1R1YIU4_9FUNG|nr:Endo-1,3(4)-beta-glucanase 1 [Smittium culicis]
MNLTLIILNLLQVFSTHSCASVNGDIFKKNECSYKLESIFDTPFKTRNNSARPNQLWGSVSKPYPTNKWWLNLVMGEGIEKIYPYPYTASANENGVAFYPSEFQASNTTIETVPSNSNWLISSKGGFKKREIYEYDDLMVKLIFKREKEEKNYMISYLLKGSPYMTFYYNSLVLVLKHIGASIVDLEARDSDNKGYVVNLSNDSKYAIFSSEPIDLIVVKNKKGFSIESTSAFTGTIRIALIPTSEDIDANFDTLYIHSMAIPVSANVEFNNNSIIHRYKVSEENESSNLLLLAHPHHIDNLDCLKYAENLYNYSSLRGDMVGVIGNVWYLVYDKLSGSSVKDMHERKIDGEYLEKIKESLENEILYKYEEYESRSIYFFGKKLARLARIALIANQVDSKEVKQKAIKELKTQITKLFEYEVDNPLYYDTTWGGICSRDGMDSNTNDHGNGIYNDHNYHYGYYLYALYSIVEINGIHDEWIQSYMKKIVFLAREFTSSQNNEYFTKFRHVDFYDGNSWVNGFHIFENSRNMESTSESVNAYYSSYLLYSKLNMTTDAHISDLLLTSEIKSSQKYWQIKDDSIYNKKFAKNKVVGILWESYVQYDTWFGSRPDYIYGIQFLPYTPISFELLSKEWLNDAWETIKTRVYNQESVSDEWSGLIKMAGAIVDSSINSKTFEDIKSYDNGNSKTNVLWWIYNCNHN